MYKNIGEKIKIGAKVIFVVWTIVAVIAGFTLLMSTDKEMVFSGLLLLVIAPVIAWVSTWIIYAFGQLVEDVHAIREKQNVTEEKPEYTSVAKKTDINTESVEEKKVVGTWAGEFIYDGDRYSYGLILGDDKVYAKTIYKNEVRQKNEVGIYEISGKEVHLHPGSDIKTTKYKYTFDGHLEINGHELNKIK